MPGIVALWDEWCARQVSAGFEGLHGAEPLSPEQLDPYEAAFWRRGFDLPDDLRELLVARGIVWVAPIELDDGDLVPGLRLLSTPRLLDDHDRHLELAELNGVARAAQWMLFTTERGDLDSAWALDHRFGAHGVGAYSQDLVSTHSVDPAEPLPSASPDIHTWLAAKLEELDARRQGLSRDVIDLALDEVHAAPPSADEAFAAARHALLTMAEARVARGGLRWETLDPDWRRLASGTQDTELLQRILDGVRADRRKGRPGVPFDLIARGADWPWDYPGPGQLVARLDEPARRKVIAWALGRAIQHTQEGTALHAAREALASGHGGPRDLSRNLCAEGWTERPIDLMTPAGRGRLLARAAALALSSPTEPNLERVLTLCATVGAGQPGAWNLLDAWDHLEAVVLGRTPPDRA
ncbi:hypothetical protein LZ198_09430 [Myxococcus sp. K15C18031901]|uniref:hypothetical protein n=1 Tax=Myxococcus dinghuensis TaxID=2906761 RepID=UPI0020A7F43B|nr:hypothetical protein [Myxococcus dinghuensis]MCP3099088.1 hypothetical protein [Myxococcus dinghuensis]